MGTDLQESDGPSGDFERSLVVGVSRRFGVGHMLAATGLFAIVFSFLQFAEASLTTYALWAFFCATIPLGQVFLYQGRDPRRASCLVGSRLLPAMLLSRWVYLLAKDAMEGRWRTLDLGLVAEGTLFIAFTTILSVGLGYGLGYVIGTISAGVFLVLDRKWDAGKRVDAAGNTPSTPCDADATLAPTGKWWLDWIAWSPVQWFWKRRQRPVRNVIVLSFLAAVPLAIGIPIFWGGEFQQAYLIGAAIAVPLLGLMLAGLLLAGWRMPLAFCALAVVGMLYPLFQVTEIWAWTRLDTDISFGELMWALGLAIGLAVSAVYGWLRWLLPAQETVGNRRSLAVGCGIGIVVFIAFVGATATYVANSPRERALHHLDSAGAIIEMASVFSVDGIFCTSEELEDDTLTNVGAIHELRWLSVYQHEISGEGMSALGRLTAMEDLSLQNCRIARGTFKELSTLSLLSELSLDWSDVVDADLEVLRAFPLLEQLSLEGTAIEGQGLEVLAGLDRIERAYLSESSVCGEGLSHLIDVPKVHLDNTPICDDDLVHLADSDRITELSLAGTGISDAGLQYLGRIKSLESLCLDNTDVTGNGLDHLKDLKHLRTLLLDDTPLDDEGLSHLPRLPGLCRLDLERTNVTKNGLKHLAALPRLGMLDLTECDIGDDDVAVFLEHPIRHVGLEGTRVTEEARSRIRDVWLEHVSERVDQSAGE